MIIGHNDRIAWGITNLGFDVQDLYVERIDMNTGRYVFKGAIEQARPEREMILVKGEKPVEHTNWITRHGPIWRMEGGQALALRWIAAEPGKFNFPFVQLNMARTWDEFRNAAGRIFAPSSNVVYADVDGNIGYQAAGLLPIRRTFQGDLPVDGSKGEAEWEGFIPSEELPNAFNPSSGVIITANQNPFPADYKYKVHGEFAPPYRAQQIRALALEGECPEAGRHARDPERRLFRTLALHRAAGGCGVRQAWREERVPSDRCGYPTQLERSDGEG